MRKETTKGGNPKTEVTSVWGGPEKKEKRGGFRERLGSMVYILNPINLIALIAKAIYTMVFTLGSFIFLIIRKIISAIRPTILIFTTFFRNIFHKVGALFPSNIKKRLEKMLLVSGLTHNPEETLGVVFIYSLTVPVAVFVLIKFILEYPNEILISAALGSLISIWVLFYILIIVIIDKRTQNVESVLPDVLVMISQNMRAGMTPYNALWAASRPEFGPLAVEIQNVARDTLAGVSFDKALRSMTHRIKSARLERVVSLMIQGMQSGGELPAVLQEIAEDIRNELALVRRMQTETTMQVMFIGFALIFGAPLLFSASNQFVMVFSKTLQEIDIPEDASMGNMITIHDFPVAASMNCGYLDLKCEEKFNFKAYCLICLFISALFGSLLMGLMRSGRIGSASGMYTAVVMVIVSITVFIILNTALGSLFSNMIAS
ncbi:MAG: type II secretion system F family protein [Candidatus Altiarchaeota archaeon]|nr:type II secretion system F family protein [Candidatus Altiarchaeota archaeon]